MARTYGEMQEYLQEASGIATQIGDGNLSVQVKPRSEQDALGNAFAQMVTNLSGLIGQVAGTADRLAEASQGLSNAAGQAGQATEGIATNRVCSRKRTAPFVLIWRQLLVEILKDISSSRKEPDLKKPAKRAVLLVPSNQ